MDEKLDLRGFLDWTAAGERRAWIAEIVDRVAEDVCDSFGIGGVEELIAGDGEPLLDAMTSVACEIACAAARSDGSSMARDYLERAGGEETALNRALIGALHGSRLSVYEVSGIAPGEGFVLRDLLFGAEPVRVHAPSESREALAWDLVVARVLAVRGAPRLGSATACTPRRALRSLDGLMATIPLRGRLVEREGVHDANFAADLEILEFWFLETLSAFLLPRPGERNSDGERMEFATHVFPLAPGADPEAVSARLDGLDGFERGGKELEWRWLGGDSGDGRSGEEPGIAGRRLAAVRLRGGELDVRANSRSRANAARGILERGLAGLVGEPAARIVPFDEFAVAAPEPGTEGEGPDAERDRLTRRFRKALSEPSEMLGDRIPLDLAKAGEGRENLAAWLKSIENRAAAEELGGEEGYDFAWMWEELGVAELRR